MKVSSILVLLCGIILISAIDPIKDKEDYLKQLIKQYQNIKRYLNDIQTIDSNLKINIGLVNNETSELKLRVAALQDQQKLLLKMLQNSFLRNAIKTWNCPAISHQQFSVISKLQNQIAFQTEENIKTINSQPYCFRNSQMQEQNLFLSIISKGLKEEIVDKCVGSLHLTLNIPFLDTEISRYYPNLATQSPWAYGKISQNQFKDKVQQLVSLYGVFPCPVTSPFLSLQNQCIKCNGDGQVYDISEKRCKICGARCSLNGGLFNSNPYGTNTIGNSPTLIPGIPYCTKNMPFFDKKQCISCNLPLYFNFNNDKCEKCPQDQGYDQVLKKCKSNVFFISLNHSVKNFIGNQIQPPPYSTIKKCPEASPYTTGIICQACLLPKFYNYNFGECQACPGGFNFDIQTQRCRGGKGAKMNSNLLGMRNFIGKVPIYQSLFVICPQNKRFFNGIQCIECLLPQYFNFQSLRCESCPLKMTFDSIIQACQSQNPSFITNLLSPNIYFNGNFNELQLSLQAKKMKGLKQCESIQPFFNSRSNKCIQCLSSNPLFDIKRSICINCPKGSNYDPSLRICLADKVQAKIQRMIMNSR